MTDEEEGRGRVGHECEALTKKGNVGPKPPSGSYLTDCFKLACGERGSSVKLLRISEPPSELFFKNGVRALWADKHCPRSLSGFQCHAQQTQQLKQLISRGICPQLLLEGPRGAGKKALATALLHDIFGDVKILHQHKPFTVQGAPNEKITVPIATSRHHVEINLLHIGKYDKHVLPTIFKEINLSSERAMKSPFVSQTESEWFKLILVLHGEMLSGDAQLILRRLMDRYEDTCKLVMCCDLKDETEPVLSEGIKSRCQVINVEVPTQEEIVRVLMQVAKKEDIILPKHFAARIAEHCKDNLRRAIVQLEACKNYQYPFSVDQRLHISHWEEDVVEIVADILADPTLNKFFLVGAKMRAVLADRLSPVLILQKLLEELLQQTDSQKFKKQICQWAGFYETRLRTVPKPIFQLEAFLAKVTSVHRVQSTPKSRRSLRTSPSADFPWELEISPSSSPFLGTDSL